MLFLLVDLPVHLSCGSILLRRIGETAEPLELYLAYEGAKLGKIRLAFGREASNQGGKDVGGGGMNLPNKLTVMRMALIPFFLIFMLCDGIPHRYLIARKNPPRFRSGSQ